jgi:hypothetical protein
VLNRPVDLITPLGPQAVRGYERTCELNREGIPRTLVVGPDAWAEIPALLAPAGVSVGDRPWIHVGGGGLGLTARWVLAALTVVTYRRGTPSPAVAQARHAVAGRRLGRRWDQDEDEAQDIAVHALQKPWVGNPDPHLKTLRQQLSSEGDGRETDTNPRRTIRQVMDVLTPEGMAPDDVRLDDICEVAEVPGETRLRSFLDVAYRLGRAGASASLAIPSSDVDVVADTIVAALEDQPTRACQRMRAILAGRGGGGIKIDLTGLPAPGGDGGTAQDLERDVVEDPYCWHEGTASADDRPPLWVLLEHLSDDDGHFDGEAALHLAATETAGRVGGSPSVAVMRNRVGAQVLDALSARARIALADRLDDVDNRPDARTTITIAVADGLLDDIPPAARWAAAECLAGIYTKVRPVP